MIVGAGGRHRSSESRSVVCVFVTRRRRQMDDGEGKTRVSMVNEGAGPWEGHFALRPHGRLFVQQLMCPAEEVAGAAWAPSQE